MNQEEFEKSIRSFAESTFKKVVSPKDLVNQEKEKMKINVKRSIKEFIETTGIEVDRIEVFIDKFMDNQPHIFLTIHLKKMM